MSQWTLITLVIDGVWNICSRSYELQLHTVSMASDLTADL